MSDVAPKPKKFRLWIHYTIAVIIVLGYVSAWISLSACESATARRMMRTVRPGQQFFIHKEEADARRLAVWNRVGANYRVYDPAKDGQERFPWCSVGKSQFWLLFVSTVEYGWIREPEVGDGGKIWYFCFFGLVVEIGETISWMT